MSTPVGPGTDDRSGSTQYPAADYGDADHATSPYPEYAPAVTHTSQRQFADRPVDDTASFEPVPERTVDRTVERNTVVDRTVDRDTLVARQQERFGGMKFGSAFFGWLTATGVAVLLTSLLTAAGVAFGLATTKNVDQATAQANNATAAAKTVGLVSGIVLLVILFIAYFCGGYVAGRMARFNGAKQGVAVWIWAIITTLVIAALTAAAGAKYNLFAQLNLPRIPVNEGSVTTTAIIAIVAALLAALLGAVLGGQTGMRFHRKVDDAGLQAR